MPQGVASTGVVLVGLTSVLTFVIMSSNSGTVGGSEGFAASLTSQWPLSVLFGASPAAGVSWKHLAAFDLSGTTQAVLIFWAAHLLYGLLKTVARTIFADADDAYDDDDGAAQTDTVPGDGSGQAYPHDKAGADTSDQGALDSDDEDLGSATTPSRGNTSLNDSRRPSSFFSSFLSVSSFFTPPSSPSSPLPRRFTELRTEEEYVATKTEHTRAQLLRLRDEWGQLDEDRRRRITHRRYVEEFAGGATDIAELDEGERETLREDLRRAMLFDSHMLRTLADSPTVRALRFSMSRFVFALGAVALFATVHCRSHSARENAGAGGVGGGPRGSLLIDWLAQQLHSLSGVVGEGQPAVEATTALVLAQVVLRLALRFREAAFAVVRTTGLLDMFNSVLRVVIAGDTRPILALALNPALVAVVCTVSGTALGLISQDALKTWLLYADDSHASPVLPVTLLLTAALFLGHQLTARLISHPTRRGVVDTTASSTAPAFSLAAAVAWTTAAHILATLLLSAVFTDVPPLFAGRPTNRGGGFTHAERQPHMPWLPPIVVVNATGAASYPSSDSAESSAPAFDAYDAVSTQYASIVTLVWSAFTAVSWALPAVGLLLVTYGHTLLHAALVVPLGLSFLVLLSPACFVLARLVLLSWPSAFFLLGISLPISVSTCLALGGLRSALNTMPAFFSVAPTVLLASALHVFHPMYLSAARVIAAAYVNALVFNAHVVPASVRRSDDRQLLAQACSATLCRFTGDAEDCNTRVAEMCHAQAEHAWTLPRVGGSDVTNAVHLAMIFAFLSLNGSRLQTKAIALATIVAGLILLIPVLPAAVVNSAPLSTAFHLALITTAVEWQHSVSSRLTRSLHLDPTHPFLAPQGVMTLFLRNMLYGAALVTAIEHLSPFAPKA